jgi:acyl carrier protein
MSGVLDWLETIGYFIGFLIVIGIPILRYQTKRKRQKLQIVFSGRQPLNAQTFYEKYFRALDIPADIVIKIRNILEEILEADLSCLQAEDDLTKNLSFLFDYDSMAGEELVSKLEEEFKINITFAEAENAHTIEEIVKLVRFKVSKS